MYVYEINICVITYCIAMYICAYIQTYMYETEVTFTVQLQNRETILPLILM